MEVEKPVLATMVKRDPNPEQNPKPAENPNTNPNPEQNPNLNLNPEQNPDTKSNSEQNRNSESIQEESHGVKRKHCDEEALDSLWKTSLCSYFRRQAQDCRHGDKCRYAHGEQELRPRPDNSWDPTSETAKKLKGEKELDLYPSEDPKGLPEGMTAGGDGSTVNFSKCIIHLPNRWDSGNLKRFLDSLELPYTNARKNWGTSVGFVTFSSAEHVILATEKLNGKSLNKRQLKVSDLLPRTWEKQQVKQLVEGERDDQYMDDSSALNSETIESEVQGDGDPVESQNSATDRSIVKPRSARDAVTPLAYMPYDEQLNYKKKSVIQILKKLTRNARKACPSGLPHPEWILSSRNQGGLPCKFEGVLNSPAVNGYRNKCEFTIGHSTDGKTVVGFLLGNFREGLTAVEEPTNCPNVSATACKYASIFQNFVRSSPLPVWNKYQNSGFWRLFTVREGRAPKQVSNSDNEQPDIIEVMLIAQICSTGVNEDLRSSEFKRMAQELTLAAVSASPLLPLTVLFVQDNLGISNAAPADAPLFPIPLPKVAEGRIVCNDCKKPEGQIHDYINNLCFRISPTAFFQVNTLAAERLYSLAGDWAALSPSTLLFDVCCGTGTIGLTLANRAGMVVGIEMVAPAVADAQRNAEINDIKNCRFVCAKAEDVMDSLLKEYLGNREEAKSNILGNISDQSNGNTANECSSQSKEQEIDSSVPANEGDNAGGECEKLDNKSTSCLGITNKTNGHSEINSEVNKEGNATKQFKDVVAIVDPPRCGLHPVVIKALRTHPRLRRLVYISCNPETLVANAIELCTPSTGKVEKGNGNKGGYRHMGNLGHARQRAKSMPMSEPFHPIKAMAVDLFPHTPHCEMVMLLER